MDFGTNLINGLSVAFQPINISLCFFGVFIGMLIGVLPGIGPVGSMAILLPITYSLSPDTAIIMLAGIYYGAQYGGTITSVLVNIPGEATTIVTCLDGHQMALQGRAGPALGISAFGSFIAATFSIIALQVISGPLVSIALRFGPPEYFSLMMLGFTILTFLGQQSMIRAFMMAGVGVFLGTVGIDIMTGIPRFTFNSPQFFEGVGLAPLAMGLFGVSEIFLNVELKIKEEMPMVSMKFRNLLPTVKDWSNSIWSILRGSVVGFFLGILPGGGAVLGSFVSYVVEKRLSKHPEEFGKGAIEGVAAPESANNAAATGAFIPLLTLGIPGNVVTAILLGALMIHGITPGPMLMASHPDVFWGVIASMYIGNLFLVILNIPLISLWVRLLRVPYAILFPLLLFITMYGAYLIKNSTTEIFIMLAFGILGYLMRKFEYEAAPLVLAYVLSGLVENAFRQSLIISEGGFGIFFTRPISLGFLIITGLILITSILPGSKKALKKLS